MALHSNTSTLDWVLQSVLHCYSTWINLYISQWHDVIYLFFIFSNQKAETVFPSFNHSKQQSPAYQNDADVFLHKYISGVVLNFSTYLLSLSSFYQGTDDNIQLHSQVCSLLKPTGDKQAVDMNQVHYTLWCPFPIRALISFLVPAVRLNLCFYQDIWKIAL